MSNFTPMVTEDFDFDGDTVTVTFERMKRKHIVLLSPHMDPSQEGVVSFEDQVQFTEVAVEILPEVVKTLTGLVDSGGNNIALDTVLEETYFTKLVADIMSAVMKNSFLKSDDGKGEDEEKKSDKQSGEPLKGSKK